MAVQIGSVAVQIGSGATAEFVGSAALARHFCGETEIGPAVPAAGNEHARDARKTFRRHTRGWGRGLEVDEPFCNDGIDLAGTGDRF